MILPNSIDHHSSGHRVFWSCNPFCQFQSSASLRNLRFILSSQYAWKMPRDGISKTIVPSTNVNSGVMKTFVCGLWGTSFLYCVGHRKVWTQLLAKLLKLGLFLQNHLDIL